MISLEQISLLEQKVESAVAKILQLTEERAGLLQQCAQLESENRDLKNKLLSFEQDQEKIEQGIIKALDRLNVVENSVLQAISSHQEPDVIRDDGEEVQISAGTPAQQAHHTESEIFHGQAHDGLSLQQDQSIALAPMFSEEIESEERESYEPSSSPEFQDENLFGESQDDYDSGQLDIF